MPEISDVYLRSKITGDIVFLITSNMVLSPYLFCGNRLEAVLRFELKLLDSESSVITITLYR